jgi:hypothetical protein
VAAHVELYKVFGEPMESTDAKTKIIVAIIAAVGVVVAAVMTNRGKKSEQPSPAAAIPMQISNGSNSQNISDVHGDVNIKASQPELKVPTFEGGTHGYGATRNLDSSEAVQQFVEFMDSKRGKLVHINVALPPEFSDIPQQLPGEVYRNFYVTDSACESPDSFPLSCMEEGFEIYGADYGLGWYSGHNELSGYFVIDENTEMHQGRWWRLNAVSPSDVLLQVQRSP